MKNELDNCAETGKVPTYMRSNPLTTALTWILGTSVILSVIFSIQFLFRTRELRTLQGQLGQIQATQQRLNQLLNDVAEYGSHNPAIKPVLESAGLKVNGSPTAPTTKPATR